MLDSRLLGVTAALAALLCFAGVLRHEFVVYDDAIHVYKNPYFSPATPSNLGHFWVAPHKGLYVPVTYTVWGAIAAFCPQHGDRGPDPAPFHAANLIVHALSVLVVFALLRLLLRSDAGAFAGALLFGLHPLQVESVAWVSGLKSCLGGLLALTAVWQYVRHVSLGPGAARRAAYWLATAAFIAAMLASPGAVVAPIIAALLACLVLRRPIRQTVREMLPWLLLAVPVILVTKLSQPDAQAGFVPALWQRPLVAGDALLFYAAKFFMPVNLAADYGRTPQFVLSHGWSWVTGTAPWFAAALVLWRGRRPWLMAALGVSVAALLPVLGLVPFVFQRVSTVADRYVYVAMLGPALALAWFAARTRSRLILAACVGLAATFGFRARTRSRLVLAACVVLVAALGFRSAGQVRFWKDTATLFGHTLELNPQSWVAHLNLGVDAEEHEHLDDALAHYEAATRLNPRDPIGHYNLGHLRQKKGQLDLAAKHYRDTLDADPTYLKARQSLAATLVARGQLDAACEELEKAIPYAPQWRHDIYTRMGVIREQQNRLTEARAFYEKALAAQPGYQPARWRLDELLRLGQ